MADSKLSDLSAAASLASTDLFYVVKTAGSGGVKATLSQLNILYAGLGANTFTSLQTITVGAANTGVLASTGYSLTGSDATPMVNLAGTWNTSGRPTGIKLNVTNTASAANSRLLDIQVGGTSVFNVDTYSVNVINKLMLQSTPDSSTYTYISYDRLSLGVNAHLSWGSTAAAASSADTYVYRDAAGVLAQRNGANAQKFRTYSTYTDSSNYERAAINTTAGTQIELAAETAGTGGDNLDVVLTPAGTGVVKFGSYTALGAEALAGYITIKDAAGNTRKLAVIA